MAYTVFARKYRPQTFAELVGQEHVARTLSNAIEAERVAHAFLFTGVRGVGKTTTARLLAKALNCETGPTSTPCNVCDVCKDITSGVDIDVQEIDGASNNGVDDVRRLQESLPFRPARDRFKIVIVDEVHMLSTGAFNAFLKTLEEPPPHVKFIFATTESHKVPVTIKSRCQRYDFRLIPQTVIAQGVRKILDAEKIDADDDVVSLVAREAAGSMRDALTLLDQLVAFGGEKLVGEEVSRYLGVAARALVQDTASAILEGDPRGVLVRVNDALGKGVNAIHLVRQLVQLFRDLVVLKVAEDDAGLVDLVAEEKTAATKLAGGHDVLELQRVFAVIAKLVDEVANASNPGLVLEMGLVRAATRPSLRGVAELLGQLESGGGGGGGGSSRPSRRGPPRRPQGGGRQGAQAEPAPEDARREPRREARGEERPRREEPREEPRAERPRREEPRPEPRREEPRREERPAASKPAPMRASEPPPEDPGPAMKPAPPEPPQPKSHVPRESLHEWEGIVEALRDSKPALAAVLEHGIPRAVTGERIILSFQDGSFYGRQAKSPAAIEAITEAAKARLGTRPKVEIRFDAESSSKRTVASVEATRREAETAAKRREALSHPAVRDAMDVFPESRGKVEVRLDE